jgi:Ion channel
VSYITRFWDNDKGFIWLLTFMVLLIVTSQLPAGLSADLLILRIIFFAFTIITIASSVLSTASKRIGYVVALSVFLLGISLLKVRNPTLMWVYSIVLTSYMVFIFVLIVKQIFNGESITFRKIGGGIAAYLLLGHLWASLYVTVYLMNPSAFLAGGEPIDPGEALRQLSYFSFITLTTTGYGDITAVGPLARALGIFEGLTGQLFPAVFIAKLVSQQIEDSRK